MDPLKEGANRVAAVLREAGYEAYFAGGCVRDTILGVAPKDYDVVTDATPPEVTKLFRRTIQIGASFGVVKVLLSKTLEYEVATYREDGDYSDGRRPDAVSYSKSKVEDVERRDFTINGLLMDPETDEILDFVGGREDLDRKLVRAVGDAALRFAEDRLRMLRAVRFAVRFDFDIETETLAAIRANAAFIDRVSAERVVQELLGIFRSPNPGRGAALLADTGLLGPVLPFVDDAAAFEARMTRFGAARESLDEGQAEDVAWAIAAASVSSRRVERELRALKLSRERIRGATTLLSLTETLRAARSAEEAAVVRVAADEDVDTLVAFLGCVAEEEAKERLLAARSSLAANPLPARPLVTGADLQALGLRPSRHFKTLLSAVDDAVLERRVVTKEEGLALVAAHPPE